VAVVVAFLARDGLLELDWILATGMATGAAVGGVFGWRVKSSRVCHADAKIVAGAFAGLLASASVVVPRLLGAPLPLHLELLLVAPLSGLLYVSMAPYCVCHLSDMLPPCLDGAVVGAGVGALMAMLFWLMAGTLEGYLCAADQCLVDQITTRLPGAIGAAALGTASVGVLRAVLNVRWYDL
jgi:hypothetical protein